MKIKNIFALTPLVFSLSVYASTLEHCPAIESITPIPTGALSMKGNRHYYTAPALSQDCGTDRNQACEWIGDTSVNIWEKQMKFAYALYHPEPAKPDNPQPDDLSHGKLSQCTYSFTGGKYNQVSGEFSLKLLKPSKQDGSKTDEPIAKLEDLDHWKKEEGYFGRTEYVCTGEGNPKLCTFTVD